jgi:hypothetical protein
MARERVSRNRLKGLVKRKVLSSLDSIGTKIQEADLEETIVVAGVPRGGTTWLMEILATLPGYLTVFEPLNQVWFPVVADMDIGPRPYIPPGAEAHKVREYLAKIFAGEVPSTSSHHSLTLETIRRRLCAKKVIVKFVRANRLLPWMATSFHLRKIYFIIRHPCAVVESQMRTGITGYDVLSEVCLFPRGVGGSRWQIWGRVGKRSIDRRVEVEDILEGASQIRGVRENSMLMDKLKTLSSQDEILAALWCLDNYVPFGRLGSSLWHTVIYEELVTDGRKVLKEIFDFVGEEVPSAAYDKLRAPSSTSKSDLTEESRQLSRWKRVLSPDQIARIMRVLEWFGFDRFYSEDPKPDHSALRRV